MQLIRQRWEKHMVWPIILGVVLVIGVTYVNAFTWKDQATFELRHLKGDPSVIKDVSISGELVDGYHRTNFRVEGGDVVTSTEVFAKPKYEQLRRDLPGFSRLIDDTLYEIYNYSWMDFELRSFELQKKGLRRGAAIAYLKTGLVYPSKADNSISFTNHLERALAKVGEKIYYTVPTTKDYRGTNGIYELIFNEPGAGYNDTEKQFSQILVPISLEGQQDDASSGIEILGLESIGDKLALVMVVDGDLVIKGYESSTGDEWGEASVQQFRPFDWSSEDNVESHYEQYEAFSDEEEQILNISFNSNMSMERDARKTMLSFDFSEGVRLVNMTKASFTDGVEEDYPNLLHMSYRNDKLYVLKVLREYRENHPEIVYTMLLPKHLYIHVYEGSSLLYQGELATDANDDFIKVLNLTPAHGGFGYDDFEYRIFDQIDVH